MTAELLVRSKVDKKVEMMVSTKAGLMGGSSVALKAETLAGETVWK